MEDISIFILNDDLQIEDILSGAAGGSPDCHTVYMRAGLSFVLSLLYRIEPDVPWFGLFLWACLIAALAVIFHSVYRGKSGIKGSCVAVGLFLLFFPSLFLTPHYTVVAAACGAAALFSAGNLAAEGRELKLKDLIPAVVMLKLCDAIRPQVFLMLAPLCLIAFVYLCIRAGKKSLKPVLTAAGMLASAWLVFAGVHALAYSAPEWKEYLALNDARTDLYDYTGVWESDAAKEYYRGLGVSGAELPLYLNYSLLADEEADAERFSSMAAWVEPGRTLKGREALSAAVWNLRHKCFSEDLPYSAVFLLVFAACLVMMIMKKELWGSLAAIAAAGLHILLYLYLLYRGRAPERVTLSLYMAGTAWLAGLLAGAETDKKKEIVPAAVAAAVLAAAAVFIHPFKAAGEQRAVNIDTYVLYSYMAEKPEEIFLLDTYAAVDRTRGTFEHEETPNVVTLGGWIYGSPLQEHRLEALGIGDAEKLLTDTRCRFVVREGVGLEVEELNAFLAERYGDCAPFREEYRLTSGAVRYIIYSHD